MAIPENPNEELPKVKIVWENPRPLDDMEDGEIISFGFTEDMIPNFRVRGLVQPEGATADATKDWGGISVFIENFEGPAFAGYSAIHEFGVTTFLLFRHPERDGMKDALEDFDPEVF